RPPMETTEHKLPNYMLIWLYLFILTGAEVLFAFEMPISQLVKILCLMVLAVVKALLVALFFMHLKFERWRLRVVFMVPLPHAAHPRPSPAVRAGDPARRRRVRGGHLDRGGGVPGHRGQPADRGPRGADARQLRPVLHAAQAQDVAQYADRRRAGRAADRGRVDRRRGRARARGGGAVLDPVSVAAAAFPGARLDLPGRLPPRRAGHALGRRPGWAPHRP